MDYEGDLCSLSMKEMLEKRVPERSATIRVHARHARASLLLMSASHAKSGIARLKRTKRAVIVRGLGLVTHAPLPGILNLYMGMVPGPGPVGACIYTYGQRTYNAQGRYMTTCT